ncbi:MAG: NusG domain II-containing protein [Clostridiaceae bacterium]|nr:NusG domain II-containing protein [Clostridiaceae bacterium]
MKMKKGDLIIIVILAVALISWFIINNPGTVENERQIVIETNGDLYKAITMEEGMEQQEFHIELENGKYIDIVVDENGAYVKDVVCPDKVCQKTGLINRVGQSIVCLPNRVVIYIEGQEESEIDGISF